MIVIYVIVTLKAFLYISLGALNLNMDICDDATPRTLLIYQCLILRSFRNAGWTVVQSVEKKFNNCKENEF